MFFSFLFFSFLVVSLFLSAHVSALLLLSSHSFGFTVVCLILAHVWGLARVLCLLIQQYYVFVRPRRRCRILACPCLFLSHVYFVRMCILLPYSWFSRFRFVRICIPFGCASCSLALGPPVSDSFTCVLRSDVPLAPGLVALPFLFRSHLYFVRMCLCLRARSYLGTVIGHMCADSFIKISGFSLALWLGMWSMAQFS